MICSTRNVFLSLSLLLVFMTAVSAATPEEYRSRIGQAAGRLKGLSEMSSDGDRSADVETIRTVKNLIPANELIDWPGGTVETQNPWVGAELDRYAAEKAADKAGQILTGLIDRLTSLEMRIVEAAQAAAIERSKDDDKQKLDEILKREEYQKPQPKAESVAERWWRVVREWIEGVFPRPSLPDGAPTAGVGSMQFAFQILLYLAILGVVAFLVAKFAPLLFRRAERSGDEGPTDRVILGERVRSDESAADLFSDAEELARKGEMRSAIRKGYIAMLCELGDRKIVTLASHKTNRDYLRDVKRDDELFKNLAGLTNRFENSWYGLRASASDEWEQFRALYRSMLSEAKRK